MLRLTTGDLAEVVAPAGITVRQLRHWCESGRIAPAGGGITRGYHRRFTLMQAVGVAVAALVYRTRRGCAPWYIGDLVMAISRLTQAGLEQQFGKFGSHLVAVAPKDDGPHLVLGAPAPDRIDIQATYLAVRAKVAEMSRRPGNPTGRNRGLTRVGLTEE